MLSVYTFGFGICLIPEPIDGIAGEDGDQDDRYPPSNNHSLDNVGRELKSRDCKDSAIEGEHRELDR